MKFTILRLHAGLKRELDQIRHQPKGLGQIALSQQAASRYWLQAKIHIRESGFRTDRDEIEFFKIHKPKLASQIEYYILRYRLQLYKEGDPRELPEFLDKERQRLERFKTKHAAFIRYCEEGSTSWDEAYFLRRNYLKQQRPQSQVYDRAKDFWTNGDWIVTLNISNRLFEQYLDDQGF
jgi:hypothetical protein